MCSATRSSVNRLACVLIVRLVRLLPAHASTQRRTRCSIVMVSYWDDLQKAKGARREKLGESVNNGAQV